MAAKVGPSALSYGIGVQNRYSAFLEDEDSSILSNIIKKPSHENHAASKQKTPVSSTKNIGAKSGQRPEASSNNPNKKQDGQQKGSVSQATNGQNIKGDMRRQQRDGKPQVQQQQQQNNAGNLNRSSAGRNRSFNNDGAPSSNGAQKFTRNQPGGSPNQTNLNHQQSKENQSNQSGQRSFRPNNFRSNQRPRVQNDDRKAQTPQLIDGQQVNGHLTSIDEEKARRQQRRLNNLRFKDPEKRERRNQATADGAAPQAKVKGLNEEGPAEQRGQRNRREMDKNRARPRRNNSGSEPTGENTRRENKRDRPNRQRNGFSGSEGGASGRQEKPKPIPNFSDKADFPSLAS